MTNTVVNFGDENLRLRIVLLKWSVTVQYYLHRVHKDIIFYLYKYSRPSVILQMFCRTVSDYWILPKTLNSLEFFHKIVNRQIIDRIIYTLFDYIEARLGGSTVLFCRNMFSWLRVWHTLIFVLFYHFLHNPFWERECHFIISICLFTNLPHLICYIVRISRSQHYFFNLKYLKKSLCPNHIFQLQNKLKIIL